MSQRILRINQNYPIHQYTMHLVVFKTKNANEFCIRFCIGKMFDIYMFDYQKLNDQLKNDFKKRKIIIIISFYFLQSTSINTKPEMTVRQRFEYLQK